MNIMNTTEKVVLVGGGVVIAGYLLIKESEKELPEVIPEIIEGIAKVGEDIFNEFKKGVDVIDTGITDLYWKFLGGGIPEPESKFYRGRGLATPDPKHSPIEQVLDIMPTSFQLEKPLVDDKETADVIKILQNMYTSKYLDLKYKNIIKRALIILGGHIPKPFFYTGKNMDQPDPTDTLVEQVLDIMPTSFSFAESIVNNNDIQGAINTLQSMWSKRTWLPPSYKTKIVQGLKILGTSPHR